MTRSTLLDELRTLIGELGKGGGKISPSIYDTAQCLRFYPPVEGVEPGLEWLLAQQKADGGWCDPAVPAARDASTLAALLALKQYRTDREAQAAIRAGLAFLRKQSDQWAHIPLDGLPIAAEMIIPGLLEESQAANLALELEPYARLFQLRSKKLEYVLGAPARPGSAFTYSWEALGLAPDPIWIDATGGVGHSPAATAKWLQLAGDRPELQQYREGAESFLLRAHRATDLDIPGVVPVVFPITGFELSYGTFALLVARLLTHIEFADLLQDLAPQMATVMAANGGFTFGEAFEPDADSTAVALAVLAALDYPVAIEHLTKFEKECGFATFHQEMNASIISNAHALCALAILGQHHTPAEEFLLARQREGGEWLPDKWHSSWWYSTLEATLALTMQGRFDAVDAVLDSLVMGQHLDGGWGISTQSTQIETSYALLALSVLRQHIPISEAVNDALVWGLDWLDSQIAQTDSHAYRWLSKEVYSPRRVDSVYMLCAKLNTLMPFARRTDAEKRIQYAG